MRRFLSLVLCIGLLFGSLMNPYSVGAYYTNMSASVVVGQPDFTSTSINQGGSAAANTLNLSQATLKMAGKFLVADTENNRVLIFNSVPTVDNASAVLVIGQPDLSSNSVNQGLGIGSAAANTLRTPLGLATDGVRLFISDLGNHRVLIFNSLPTTNNTSADVVIGQQNFSGVSSNQGNVNPGANTLSNPTGVSTYGHRLVIGDLSNNRVLVFNSIPTTNNASADVVIGQQDFISRNANQGGSVGANTLNGPQRVYIDNNRIVVADLSNNRVLIYNSIPTSNNASADVVIGQTNFTSNSAYQGGSASNNAIRRPIAIYIYNNRLFILEDISNRVLVFNSVPTSNNASADLAIGQVNFSSISANQGGSAGANTISDARNIYVADNQLFVSDRGNNRVLIFNNVISTPELTLNGIEKLSDGRLKISGNVKLGEAGRYDLGGGGGISFSINGSDGAGVNSVGNEISDGNGSKFWEFSNTFEPWTSGNGTKEEWFKNFDFMRSTLGFSVKVMSKSSNTDSSKAFYFEPFKLSSFTPTSVKFTVTGQNPWYVEKTKEQLQRVKDNIDHFEVWIKKTPTVPYSLKNVENWTKYFDKISTEKISDKGEMNLTNLVPLFKLTQSNHQVKVVSVSKESNLPQDSNTLNYTQRKTPTTPRPTVQAVKIEEEQAPQPTPTTQPSPTPAPEKKTCFLWWCW